MKLFKQCKKQSAFGWLGVLALMLGLGMPLQRAVAQVDCNQCVHGGALLENVFGTNCLGQLVSGYSHAGDTVFVRMVLRNVDCCPVPNQAPFVFPFNDWHRVTNVVDSVNYGCVNLITPNLIAGRSLIVSNCFNPIDPNNTSVQVNNLTYTPPGQAPQVFAYTYTVPACLQCTTAPISVQHFGASIGRDTNSFCNPNGQVTGGGSSPLNVICPKLCVTKTCTTSGTGDAALVNFSGSLTNCGNDVVSNVVLRNFFSPSAPPGHTQGEIVVGPLALQPGEGRAVSGSYSPNCGATTNDTLIAEGTDRLGCPVTAQFTASCPVTCNPRICVIKQVVCELPTGCETNWRDLAIGVRSGDVCPSFCYRIIVQNCGQETLINVSVLDTNLTDRSLDLDLSGCGFPTTLAASQSYTCIVSGVIHCESNNDRVTAVGVGQISGIRTNASDDAGVIVREIDISCEATINGSSACPQIPCDGQPYIITNEVRICNNGDVPVLAYIDRASTYGIAGCPNLSAIPLALDPGQCTNLVLCIDAVVCPESCGVAFTNFVHVTAHVDTSKTNVCIYTRNSSNQVVEITAETECSAEVCCEQPNVCRVTGGGRQDDPLVYPHNVRYVTHGGQVGAPVGNRVCEVTDDFYLGNPCIHGRWTHVRHMQGGLRGNFHARYYDTLDCACLDTNTTVQPSGFGYNNLVYGPGTVTDQVCNADDHKVAGPQPRPAPANKIVFTGVGDWADPNGNRAPRSVLFRVDIEDRSEPGGSHPKGGVWPPDRYRIRIWVLTTAELAKLRGGGTGADKYLKGFRNAISACNGLNVQDGATVANGAAAFGVRAPDIDDGGELERGNHQIHPSIKSCDPFNPTGPGLPPHGN